MGAAWATLISFAILALATFKVSQRIFPIRYQYVRLLKLILAAVVIYGASHLIRPESLTVAIAVDFLFLASFPVVLLVLQFYEAAEVRKMRGILRALTQRINPQIQTP